MEISTLKDTSNSTPLPQPLATRAHRTIYTDAHTNTPMHTQAHTCMRAHVHTGVHTHPRKTEKHKASRPFVSLLHDVCFPTLSHQGSLAPANRGVCGLDKPESLHLNSPVQVHLLGGNLQAHRQRLFDKCPLVASCSPSPVTGLGTQGNWPSLLPGACQQRTWPLHRALTGDPAWGRPCANSDPLHLKVWDWGHFVIRIPGGSGSKYRLPNPGPRLMQQVWGGCGLLES